MFDHVAQVLQMIDYFTHIFILLNILSRLISGMAQSSPWPVQEITVIPAVSLLLSKVNLFFSFCSSRFSQKITSGTFTLVDVRQEH